jgi:hypothetical protein
VGCRGHAAQALHKIQQSAFGGKEAHQRAVGTANCLAGFHCVSILRQGFPVELRVYGLQNGRDQRQSGYNAGFFGAQHRMALLVGSKTGEGRMVARVGRTSWSQIFVQSQLNQGGYGGQRTAAQGIGFGKKKGVHGH